MITPRHGLLTCALLLFAGCGDDGTSPNPTETPLAESTIDAGGGTLEGGGCTLIVPAGAFTGDADLALYEAPTTGLPDDSVTGAYRLAGLPATVDAPLALTLACTEPPAGETLIAVGRLESPPETDPFVRYDYLEATYADGALSCAWMPDAEATKSGDAYAYFFGPRETRYLRVTDGDEDPLTIFVIDYPAAGEAAAPLLATGLEQAYPRYENLGFLFSRPDGSGLGSVPVAVTFDGATPPVDRYVLSAKAEPRGTAPAGKMTLYLDRLTVAGIDDLVTTACAAFGRIVLQTQVPHPPTGTADTTHLDWLDAAFGLWSESLFAPGPDHVPARFDAAGLDLEYGLVNGMQDTSDDRHAFGRATSALLAHLMAEEDDGAALMLRACTDLRAGATADGAFLRAPLADASAWWPDFLADFVAGAVYDAPADVFLDRALDLAMDEAEWEDSRANFYTDLSARFYRLDPAYDDWPDGAFLDVAVTGAEVSPFDLQALVFEIDGDDLTLRDAGTLVRIGGLADLHDAGRDLLVTVCHAGWNLLEAYAPEIRLDLAVGASDLAGYTRGRIEATADIYVAGEGWQSSGFYMAPYTTRDGTWNGNTLTIDMAYEDANTRETGAIVVTMDTDTGDVESFTGSVVREQFDVDLVVTREIAGGALPRHETGDGWIVWRLDGAEACDSLTRLYTRREYGGVIDEEWTDFDCHDGEPWASYLAIRLSDPNR